MPLDSIEYFGLSDTQNPFNLNITPRLVNNIYEIETYGNTGVAIVKTGLNPNVDSFISANIKIVNPQNGATIATLSPKSFSNLGTSQPPLGEVYLFAVDQFQSSLFVNGTYAGKYLQVSMLCDSCSVMGDWMNLTQGTFMEYKYIGAYAEVPKGSWFNCDGTTLVNRFLYPKYHEFVLSLISRDIFKIDSVTGNPYTPNLKGLFLRGAGSYDNDRGPALFGNVQQDTMQRLTGQSGWNGYRYNNTEYGTTGVFARAGFSYSLGSSDRMIGELMNFDNARQARTSNENRPINTAVRIFVKVV